MGDADAAPMLMANRKGLTSSCRSRASSLAPTRSDDNGQQYRAVDGITLRTNAAALSSVSRLTIARPFR